MSWANGSYRATSTNADLPYSLMLRVDLTPELGRGSYVSLDLFKGFMLETTDPDRMPSPDTLLYLDSFRSDPLGAFRTAPEQLPATRLHRVPDGLATVELELHQSPPGAPLRLSCRASNTEFYFPEAVDFEATYKDEYLHRLVLTIDATDGFPKPYAVPEDTATNRPTFFECFRRAGYLILGAGSGDGTLPLKENWTTGQLAGLEHAKPQANVPGCFFNVYLMIATTLKNNAGTTGIMFDKERRGAAAVFYQALATLFDRGPDSFELDTNFLFTAVHECAHCLNLPHVFDSRPLPGLSRKALTFMNYPQEYEGNLGTAGAPRFPGVAGWDGSQKLLQYQQFWSCFPYQFDAQELLELRHGARKDLVTGDNVGAYRGDFSGSAGCMALGGLSGVGLELTLRFRGRDRAGAPSPAKRREAKEAAARGGTGAAEKANAVRDMDLHACAVFEFGEPIQVEAQLQSYLKQPRSVERRLSPVTGDLQIHYRTPDGHFRSYVPPCVMCYVPMGKTINAANTEDEPESFHKDVCLNVGSRGFHFINPGRYQVRASYRYHDTVLVSNVLEVYVRYPLPEVENLVVPLFDPEVAMYLAFRGVSGLARAEYRLQGAFLEDDGSLRADVSHPLRNYYCAYEGLRQLDGGAGEKNPLYWLSQAFGVPDLKGLGSRDTVNLAAAPFSNIALGKIGKRFHQIVRVEARYARRAPALQRKLDEALTLRGVPKRIRDRVLHSENHEP